jgi:hypothetical protein
VEGSFEKAAFGSGIAPVRIAPARYCLAEALDAATGRSLDRLYLDGEGRGILQVPSGQTVQVILWAAFEIPAQDSALVRGSVKEAEPRSGYEDLEAFDHLPVWSAASGTFLPAPGRTVGVRARWDRLSREAGAFNIADQAVAFALGLETLQPGLILPELHPFWSPAMPGAPATGYPRAALDLSGAPLRAGGRGLFQLAIRNGIPPEADACNDGLLLQRLSHVLFAPGSGAPDTILRADNDNVHVNRVLPSESTVAFQSGFCDFLSGALRGDPLLLDQDAMGRVTLFDLTDHDQVKPEGRTGEFYSGSVAISLYGGWKALGGSTEALGALWRATSAETPMAFGNAPLGCLPTYLRGLRDALAPSDWTLVQTQLGLEGMGDVTSDAYFASPALWIRQTLPFAARGALKTYAPSRGIYYDRNQSLAYRFTRATAGPCTIVMTPAGGQDCFVELIGRRGLLYLTEGIADHGGPAVRTLSLPWLEAGDYVVRVRAGNTTADRDAAEFTLTVN